MCVLHIILHPQKQIEGHVPDDRLWDCSNYLVGNVFASLRETFSNARVIQVSYVHTTFICINLCTEQYSQFAKVFVHL